MDRARLTNLLGNASKYSPTGTTVTVVVEAAADEVHVAVLDEGAGIAPDEAKRIFEPFYRSRSTQGSVPGAGLGLTACRRIVDAMGGRVWVRSRPTGDAEFGFALPIAPRDDADGDPRSS